MPLLEGQYLITKLFLIRLLLANTINIFFHAVSIVFHEYPYVIAHADLNISI